MMTNIETLLKQISEIVVKERIQQEEKRNRGENFNIFSVLGLSTSEVRLHSALLGELLNPEGDHGLGSKFLEAFVDFIIKRVDPEYEIDTTTCEVRVEYPIGEIPEDYTEGGRIDLLIRDNHNHAIVIENKIDAIDQKKQLLRYQNYAKKNTQKYVILYLTKSGTDPSPESTCGQVDYKCISYEKDILPWLDQCVSIAALFPRIRETIAQYQTNLNQIMSIMSEINKQAIVELLINKSNVEAALKIISMSDDIPIIIRTRFVKNALKELAEKHKMDFSYDNEFPMLGSRGIHYKTIRYKLQGYNNCYFQIENEGNEVYYGIVSAGYPESQRIKMEEFDDWSDASKLWVYGHKIFPGNLRWWDSTDSLTDMVKGTKIKDIIDNELTKIREHRLIERYSELMDGRAAIDTQAKI